MCTCKPYFPYCTVMSIIPARVLVVTRQTLFPPPTEWQPDEKNRVVDTILPLSAGDSWGCYGGGSSPAPPTCGRPPLSDHRYWIDPQLLEVRRLWASSPDGRPLGFNGRLIDVAGSPAVPPSPASFAPTCMTRRKEASQLWCTNRARRGERRRAACYID
jgi:hypothetical protein